MTEDRILFETEVGSGMWGMRKPESDWDIIQVYAQPIRDILSGYNTTRSKPQKKFMKGDREWDYQFFEIGHLVNLLIKGNVNAIWAVTSPIVMRPSPVLDELREIVVTNLSKASFDSIHGMAISNYKDHTKRPNMPKNKAWKQCVRTLTFGIHLFEEGKIVFEPITHEVTNEEIEETFKRFETAKETTNLINSPREEVYRIFLYNLRISELK